MSDTQNVYIDKDSLELLQFFIFKSTADPFTACCRRAYLDFNRTLHLKKEGKNQAQSNDLSTKGTEILRKSILQMMDAGIDSQDKYDSWHFKVCTALRKLYREAGVSFTYGQSQKWLNMTMKYLYVLRAYSFEDIFAFLHPPIDNYIFDAAMSEFEISRFPMAWSKLDDYQTYLDYQKSLRTQIFGCPPLRWEFRAWLREAKKKAHDWAGE